MGVLHRSLERHEFSAAALHGDMAQPARMATLDSFKKGEVDLLVCSDVAARGLDIPAVSHVFNFDVPGHAEDYIHRIGRTGRAGRSGRAFTLVMPEDGKALSAITRLIGKPLAETTLEGVCAPEPLDADEEETEGRGGRRGRRRRGGKGAKSAANGDARPQERRPNEDSRADEDSKTDRKPRDVKRKSGKDSPRRSSKERKPSDQPSNPTESFGDHTPAFLLRPVKLAVPA